MKGLNATLCTLGIHNYTRLTLYICCVEQTIKNIILKYITFNLTFSLITITYYSLYLKDVTSLV
jgi:hypothetical protein